MAYKRMVLDYFKELEKLLDYNVYVKISLNSFGVPIVAVVEYTEKGEKVIIESILSNSVSKNILDLIHEISTRLNDGVPVFPQYAKRSIRRKTLDNLIVLDYQIYFYKLNDNRILGTVSKLFKGELYDVFIVTENTMKAAFESLDSEIYKNYGFWPNFNLEEKDNIYEYTKKLIRIKLEYERNMKVNYKEI